MTSWILATALIVTAFPSKGIARSVAELPNRVNTDQVRVIVNHACGTANMHDWLYAVDGDRIVDRWQVIGRGRIR